ncbi:putative phosphatidylinositol N-acetylglucosaminyltransferase subunit C [Ceratocystis fimbriata CBS 114723]|uniref:Putative phosphatidylinositol N-acetylglucosaminyltransferase subunit C n=1 Tax=Ceratocystis fimbriata CBS 114723 TaxID=1035309 RepID=A0A2C5X5D7_9PEZI|nr:putative phosphatidylinositol N-acetylglucosaminyltransferase subunit C [Ceratocystis fimbriata CBS 114723]
MPASHFPPPPTDGFFTTTNGSLSNTKRTSNSKPNLSSSTSSSSQNSDSRPLHALAAVNTVFSPPPLIRSSTAPDVLHSPIPTRSHLSPDDAFFAATHGAALGSPPGNRSGRGSKPSLGAGTAVAGRYLNHSRTRRRKKSRTWRRLLWVQQSYPDNYTDQNTFLESLQRNPRLQPYEFWPLIADCTIIVQHVCTVIIFVTSFVGIFQERVSPVSIVGFSSCATFVGWLIWERWVADEEDIEEYALAHASGSGLGITVPDPTSGTGSGPLSVGTITSPNPATGKRVVSARRRRPTMIKGAAVRSPVPVLSTVASPTAVSPDSPAIATPNVISFSSVALNSPLSPGLSSNGPSAASLPALAGVTMPQPSPSLQSNFDFPPVPIEEPRSIRRMATFKSAILIYFTLLGLSPILKSLTRSTSSDSIWTMCFCLLAINIFSFDYSGGVGTKFPVSLSTNAALMASTVLASRLPSTGQVFSLTLFSIEVFGLFPVFRIYARHRGWVYHVTLTVILVLGAGAGVGIISGQQCDARYNAVVGAFGAAIVSALAMGGCSWWLIGLQKYKNEIYGPWDPARPIIINRRFLN